MHYNLFNHVDILEENVHIPSARGENIAKQCADYNEALHSVEIDIQLLGIGSNGHIAFNDPGVADFNDPVRIKKAKLDDVCRMQQVHDGCFATLDDVPKYALTLTVPALAAGKYQFCVVPAATKANAVKNTVYGEISEVCPATILRKLDNAILYCDSDSGKFVE